MKKLIVSFACLASLSLLGCGPSEQEIKNLGFSNAAEMKEIQAKGFKTMDEYVKSFGFSSLDEMKGLQEKGFKTKQDYLDAEKARKEAEAVKALDEAYDKYIDKKKKLDWIDQRVGGYKGVIACKVNFDVAQMAIVAMGRESDYLKKLYETRGADLDLILVKHKKEDGLTQGDIDAYYSEALQDNRLAKKMDCFDIYEKSPK